MHTFTNYYDTPEQANYALTYFKAKGAKTVSITGAVREHQAQYGVKAVY